MKLDVKFFATLKEKAQTSHLVIDLEDHQPTVADLLVELVRQKPLIESSLKSVLVAVNNEFAFPEQPLSASDEIALFPPVSGG
jgi:molybdopterin converting factor subunit 1